MGEEKTRWQGEVPSTVDYLGQEVLEGYNKQRIPDFQVDNIWKRRGLRGKVGEKDGLDSLNQPI